MTTSSENLRKAIEDTKRLTGNRQFLRSLGRQIVKRIRTRTRLGKGVKSPSGDNYAKAHRLPKLKTQTVKRRRRLKRAGGLTGPKAQPAKSGINRSGKTLNNVHIKLDGKNLLIKLDKRGKVISDDLIDQNPEWEFFNLSKAEFNFLREEINKEIRKIFKRRIG